MDRPSKESDPVPSHQSSPEFEFHNPICPQPDLLSADDLFLDGVILPLHLLHLHPNHQPDPDPITESLDTNTTEQVTEPGAGPGLGPDSTPSKRWKDIFKKGEKNKPERKSKSTGSGTGAELNINIWPFSRSKSAGNGNTRPKFGLTRKVSSAPCSRSNSAGESKSRKWPSSPSRVGVHLGRASPVWQARRVKKPAPGAAKTRVLNLNVPMCIGYRQHVGCRTDPTVAVAAAAVGSGIGVPDGDSTRVSNMFNIRSLFTKKVY